MKFKMLLSTAVFAVLILCTGSIYAANGDLIVNGNLGVGTTGTITPKAEINGNMKVDGNMTVQGNLATNGSTTVGGNLTVNGTIQSTYGGVKFPDGSVQTTAKSLVWDYTVTSSPVTSVTVTGLDGSTHGGYEFEFIIVEPASSNGFYRIYYENDTTNANYNYINNRTDNAGSDAHGEPVK